jgi:starch-binding outer membrane protein, SusD/RagB family
MENFKKMTNTKYIKQFSIYLVLGFVFLTQSCSSFLEQEPGSQTSITEQLSTKNGIYQALNGTYASIEANVRGERFAVYADLQGGNLKFSPTISGNNKGLISVPINLENVYNFQDQALNSNLESFYTECYDIINQANLILEYVDLLKDATQIEKNYTKAQALTIRAYTHFLLTLVYAQNYGFSAQANHIGIVYNTSTLSDGIKYPSRETLNNTYTSILTDITTALDNYSDDLQPNGPKYSYFNKTNTKALLARIYLYKNDWQNAFDTANDVILNSGISLVTKENYITQWEQTDAPISEILLEFSIPRDSGGEVGGSLAAFFGYTSISDYEKYVASEDLLSLYELNDIRRQLFLEQPLPTLINDKLENINYYFTKKFQDNPGYVAIRLSEMYLIRAEASLKLNNLEDAKDDINIIRDRANASLLTTTNNLEEDILLERRKEMCFEGQYFFDLARQQKSISRMDGCISQVCSLNYPSPKYVLPIPQENININSNLKQNESY